MIFSEEFIDEEFIDRQIQNNPKYLTERTYFITDHDGYVCIIAVVESNDPICNLGVEERAFQFLEKSGDYNIVLFSKSTDQLKWLNERINKFLNG